MPVVEFDNVVGVQLDYSYAGGEEVSQRSFSGHICGTFCFLQLEFRTTRSSYPRFQICLQLCGGATSVASWWSAMVLPRDCMAYQCCSLQVSPVAYIRNLLSPMQSIRGRGRIALGTHVTMSDGHVLGNRFTARYCSPVELRYLHQWHRI